jgi:hypothetical protein
MGVADWSTPQEGLAPQLLEPSCDIPDPFGYAPGLRIIPYRKDFRGFARDLGAAVVGFARGDFTARGARACARSAGRSPADPRFRSTQRWKSGA